jgi:hypothetical protein
MMQRRQNLLGVFFGAVDGWRQRFRWRQDLGRLLWLGVMMGVFLSGSMPGAIAAITEAQLDEINQSWQTSAHASAEVNCSSCHQDADSQDFLAQPNHESCRRCHGEAVETFLLGKHGIRTAEEMSPLRPAIARLPMHPDALDRTMTCGSCHNVHSVQTMPAAVDACLTCHNDAHSLNYSKSQHAQLFETDKNLDLDRPSAESVSCATCHLPRQVTGETITVNHNNTYTLLPRDRMIKEVCMNCHGVEFAYNSIFDDQLVEDNFARSPTQKLETFDMIRALEERRVGG